MIKMSARGDFSSTIGLLRRKKSRVKKSLLDKYGKIGVEALRDATPVDTGKTADSWYYEIEETDSGSSLIFSNSNVQNGVQIAVILNYGHATGTGGWVEGREYLDSTLDPIFQNILNELEEGGREFE